MSEENVPKLRLKPRPTPSPSTTPVEAPSSAVTAMESAVPAASDVEAKPVRLKPRLSADPGLGNGSQNQPQIIPVSSIVPTASTLLGAPSSPVSAVPPAESAPAVPEFPPPGIVPKLEPLPDVPASAAAALTAGEPAAMPGVLPAMKLRQSRAPTGLGEPAEIAIMRAVSRLPFPPPTAEFPPPLRAEQMAPRGGKESLEKSHSKLFAIFFAVVIVGLAGFFAYTRLFSHASHPPAATAEKKPEPVTPVAQAATKAVEKIKSEQLAPLNEVVDSDKAAPKPDAPGTDAARSAPPAVTPAVAPIAAAVAAAPAPAAPTPEEPVAAPPPPPPSLAFKAWVLNVRIRGVRAGSNPRVFIEHTSYAPGDLVNPQLGISFVGYDAPTSMLTFQDKTGAVVERRN
jgi:hypothetical protein